MVDLRTNHMIVNLDATISLLRTALLTNPLATSNPLFRLIVVRRVVTNGDVSWTKTPALYSDAPTQIHVLKSRRQ